MSDDRYPALPDAVRADIDAARRLEGWSLFWLASIVAVMYLAMGSSQAMKAAWVEDLLSVVPPVLFLIATQVERRAPTDAFPLGLHRGGTLAFFLSAVSLAALGGFLVYEAAKTLLAREHPTIGSVELLGQQVWQGWVMIAALAYSAVPPVILGIRKRRLAKRIADQVLWTDAQANAADWKTALAGIVGILGVGMGWWWADAVAAGIIGLDILRDGINACRAAVYALLDGAPRELGGKRLHPAVGRADKRWGGRAVLRETGRYVRVVTREGERVVPDAGDATALMGEGEAWRVVGAPPVAPPQSAS